MAKYGMIGRLQRVENGHYRLKWWGDVVDIQYDGVAWDVSVNGISREARRTLKEAKAWVDRVWGEELMESHNLMSNKKVHVPRRDYGGCCDPGSERYWTM